MENLHRHMCWYRGGTYTKALVFRSRCFQNSFCTAMCLSHKDKEERWTILYSTISGRQVCSGAQQMNMTYSRIMSQCIYECAASLQQLWKKDLRSTVVWSVCVALIYGLHAFSHQRFVYLKYIYSTFLLERSQGGSMYSIWRYPSY